MAKVDNSPITPDEVVCGNCAKLEVRNQSKLFVGFCPLRDETYKFEHPACEDFMSEEQFRGIRDAD